jgi:hypothetical protein
LPNYADAFQPGRDRIPIRWGQILNLECGAANTCVLHTIQDSRSDSSRDKILALETGNHALRR